LDDLLASRLILGHQIGSSFGTLVDAKIRTQRLVPVETLADVPGLLRMIQAGRVDYTLLPQEEAEYWLRKDPTLTAGLVLARFTDAPAGNLSSLLFSATFDPTQQTRIDSAIEKIRNSVRYRDLTAVE
jgi:ABC-type amino acid transport substrate-binding protein